MNGPRNWSNEVSNMRKDKQKLEHAIVLQLTKAINLRNFFLESFKTNTKDFYCLA